MKIKALNAAFKMPSRGTDQAAGFDIYMPEFGFVEPGETIEVNLGFATEMPVGEAAFLMPRSSAGKKGLILINTIGLIDSDYRGEWKAVFRNITDKPVGWNADDRLLQLVRIPVIITGIEEVSELSDTKRGSGGFGSTGQ